MELSELLESLSFLESSSSVLLFDRFGLGGLLGAESPAALGLLADLPNQTGQTTTLMMRILRKTKIPIILTVPSGMSMAVSK
jgi:hypothetical protein